MNLCCICNKVQSVQKSQIHKTTHRWTVSSTKKRCKVDFATDGHFAASLRSSMTSWSWTGHVRLSGRWSWWQAVITGCSCWSRRAWLWSRQLLGTTAWRVCTWLHRATVQCTKTLPRVTWSGTRSIMPFSLRTLQTDPLSLSWCWVTFISKAT